MSAIKLTFAAFTNINRLADEVHSQDAVVMVVGDRHQVSVETSREDVSR